MDDQPSVDVSDEFMDAVAKFVRMFEVVFHYDWTYTVSIFEFFMAAHAHRFTLLETGWDENDDDIKYLSGLLCSYVRLVHILKSRGVEASVSSCPPDDWLFERHDLPKPWRDDERSKSTEGHVAVPDAALYRAYEDRVRTALSDLIQNHRFVVGITSDCTCILLSREFAINVDRKGQFLIGPAARPDVRYRLCTLVAFLNQERESYETNLEDEARLLAKHADQVLDIELLTSNRLKDWKAGWFEREFLNTEEGNTP